MVTMSDCGLASLPGDVMFYILRLCKAQDLAALSLTCRHFHHLTADEVLWKHICCRDFHISWSDLGSVHSCRKFYTNFLYKYGMMMGVYQFQLGPFGGLLEVRYKDGAIEGAQWEPSSSSDVMAPLRESILFTVNGNKVPAECLCIPHIRPHPCTIKLDKWRGFLTQICGNSGMHKQAVWNECGYGAEANYGLQPRKLQLICTNVRRNGLIHMPLILPSPSEIPDTLKTEDGTFPNQIITPGLFQGTYGPHGLEIILFRYKDESEIHGYKVTGDINVYASKVSVKILLKYPVKPSEKDQECLTALKNIEPTKSDIPVSQIAEHSFILPHTIPLETNTPLPSTCKARYHGYGQVANVWFQRPNFIPVHVIVFNNDLLGVIWMEYEFFSLYSRIKRKFTSNILNDFQSVF